MIPHTTPKPSLYTRIRVFAQKRGLAAAFKEIVQLGYYVFIGSLLRKRTVYIQKGVVKKLFNFTPYEFWKSIAQYSPQTARAVYASLSKKPLLFVVVTSEELSSAQAEVIYNQLQEEVFSNWMLIVPESVVSLFPDSKGKLISIGADIHTLKNTVIRYHPDSIVFIDPESHLKPNALLHFAEYSLRFPAVDFWYADEEVEQHDRVVPFAKPEFGPHTLLGNYLIGGVYAIASSLLTKLNIHSIDSTDEIAIASLEEAICIKRIPIPLSKRKELSNEHLLQWQKRVMKHLFISGDLVSDPQSGLWKPSIPLPLQKPLVSIIIPTKNATDILKQCLVSVFTRTNYSNFEVIVLDNNSDEPRFFEEIQLLQQQYSNLTCKTISIPFNFSKLMNEGAKMAKGEYLVLLNNDVEIISPDWLKDMLAMALVKQTGVVGAKLLYPNETIQHAGIAISKGDTFAHHVFAHKPRYDGALCKSILSIRNYSALTAACILVSKKIYEEADGFDEAFAVEYNDIDFCLKVQQLGYYNVYLPYVELFHYESISRGHPHSNKTALDRSRRETNLFQQKWNTIIADDPNWHPALAFIPQLAD